jgi:hypothetical protein
MQAFLDALDRYFGAKIKQAEARKGCEYPGEYHFDEDDEVREAVEDVKEAFNDAVERVVNRRIKDALDAEFKRGDYDEDY